MVVLAVGAVDDDALDPARRENRLEGVDVDEVLLKSFPLLGVDLLRITLEVVGGVDVLFVGHLPYPTLRPCPRLPAVREARERADRTEPGVQPARCRNTW